MQDPFGSQRDPHQRWLKSMEEGAGYEQWTKNRGQDLGTTAGNAIAWIVFLGAILLCIILITNAS